MGGAARAALRRPRGLGAVLLAAAVAAAAFEALRGAPSGAFVCPPGAAGASRRAALALLPLAIPFGPEAARAAGVDDMMNSAATPRANRRRSPKGELPKEIDSEGAVFDDWQRTEIISESTLVDPNDPKYKQLRILADMEKQQRKNEAYPEMDQETKQQKICELLGRGCM